MAQRANGLMVEVVGDGGCQPFLRGARSSHRFPSESASIGGSSGRGDIVMVMVMVIRSALVRTHQSTYYGSFGPVLLPGWVGYTRSAAVPQDVEGLTRPPLATQRPLRRPGVGVVL